MTLHVLPKKNSPSFNEHQEPPEIQRNRQCVCLNMRQCAVSTNHQFPTESSFEHPILQSNLLIIPAIPLSQIRNIAQLIQHPNGPVSPLKRHDLPIILPPQPLNRSS
mmetsp:Transcript_12002/g.22517  ORF Transcript_12002/g.22517 Transcript_12002/m.22517 type:complete len:107 (-) Transcript_12002:1261-1581(-)